MPTGYLTDIELRNLPLPAKGQVEVPVGGVPGLVVRVSMGGAKTFCLYYRLKGDRRRRRMTLRQYPRISLKQARDDAAKIRHKIMDGDFAVTAPVAEAEGEVRLPTAFPNVVQSFLRLHCAVKNRGSTARETQRQLEADFLPVWKARDIREVTKRDVVAVLDRITKRGSPSAANHALAAIRKLFAWSMRRGLIDISPCIGLELPSKLKSRDRFHNDTEIALIWNAIEPEGYPFQPMVQLLLLTGQRRGEVAGMRWSELDIVRAVWTLPAERTKANRAHEIPLSPTVLRILASLPRTHEQLVFVTDGNAVPISGFSKRKRRLDANCPLPAWSLHDLRRTMATGMGRLGIEPHIVRRILNHSPPREIDGITAVYNRFAYLEEKRAALNTWAAHVERVVRINSNGSFPSR